MKLRARKSYQNGNVERRHREKGPDIWLFRYRQHLPDGSAKRKSKIIGTVKEYKTKAEATRQAERVVLAINSAQQNRPVLFGDVINRYVAEEMPTRFSTRHAYLSYINNHIRPQWSAATIDGVSDPLSVRQWLRQLPLAPKSKAHLRTLMRRLLDCAMLWRLIPMGRNPIELVRVEGASKRQREPRVLTAEEFHRLLEHIEEEPFRTMVLTAMCLGLRCSELLALQWKDFDWENLTLLVQRAIVAGRVDAVKTKYSAVRVPLDPALAEVLLGWNRRSQFRLPKDWVFASPFQAGEMPYRAWGVQQRRITPPAEKAGLGDGIGWHTFRHSYRSWLDETGAPMKVQQELMRHSSIQTTMNIYGAAMSETKRRANTAVVRMVLPA